MDRVGRQSPTVSVILPYKDTKGPEAVELYNISEKSILPWQEALTYDIMAVDDDGLWIHQKFGYSVPRRNGKSEMALARCIWGLKNGERIPLTGGRIPGIVKLVAHTGDDQDDDRDDIGEHLVELLDRQIHAGRDIKVEDVEPAEQEGGNDPHIRTPDREDDEGDCQPSAVTEGVVGPDTVCVIHDIVEAAEFGDHTADAGRRVFALTGGRIPGIVKHHPEINGIVSFGADDFFVMRDNQSAIFDLCNANYDYHLEIIKDISSLSYNEIYHWPQINTDIDEEVEMQHEVMKALADRGYVIYERKEK